MPAEVGGYRVDCLDGELVGGEVLPPHVVGEDGVVRADPRHAVLVHGKEERALGVNSGVQRPGGTCARSQTAAMVKAS